MDPIFLKITLMAEIFVVSSVSRINNSNREEREGESVAIAEVHFE
jgi:hypothetical protein